MVQHRTQERIDALKLGRGGNQLQQDDVHHVRPREKRSRDLDLDVVVHRRVGVLELGRGEVIVRQGPLYEVSEGLKDDAPAVTREGWLNVSDGRVGGPRRLLDVQVGSWLGVCQAGVLHS